MTGCVKPIRLDLEHCETSQIPWALRIDMR